MHNRLRDPGPRDVQPAAPEPTDAELIAAIRRRIDTCRPGRRLPEALDRLAQLFDPPPEGMADPPADSGWRR